MLIKKNYKANKKKKKKKNFKKKKFIIFLKFFLKIRIKKI